MYDSKDEAAYITPGREPQENRKFIPSREAGGNGNKKDIVDET